MFPLREIFSSQPKNTPSLAQCHFSVTGLQNGIKLSYKSFVGSPHRDCQLLTPPQGSPFVESFFWLESLDADYWVWSVQTSEDPLEQTVVRMTCSNDTSCSTISNDLIKSQTNALAKQSAARQVSRRGVTPAIQAMKPAGKTYKSKIWWFGCAWLYCRN